MPICFPGKDRESVGALEFDFEIWKFVLDSVSGVFRLIPPPVIAQKVCFSFAVENLVHEVKIVRKFFQLRLYLNLLCIKLSIEGLK